MESKWEVASPEGEREQSGVFLGMTVGCLKRGGVSAPSFEGASLGEGALAQTHVVRGNADQQSAQTHLAVFKKKAIGNPQRGENSCSS